MYGTGSHWDSSYAGRVCYDRRNKDGDSYNNYYCDYAYYFLVGETMMEPQPHPIIYRREIDTLRGTAGLIRDLCPASAGTIERICARVENRASHGSAGASAEGCPDRFVSSEKTYCLNQDTSYGNCNELIKADFCPRRFAELRVQAERKRE